jgi:hypothetical protein
MARQTKEQQKAALKERLKEVDGWAYAHVLGKIRELR